MNGIAIPNPVVDHREFDPLYAHVGEMVLLRPHPGETVGDLAAKMREAAKMYYLKHGLSFVADARDGYFVRFKRIKDGWQGRLSEWLSLSPGERTLLEPYASEDDVEHALQLAEFLNRRWGLQFTILDHEEMHEELWVQRVH